VYYYLVEKASSPTRTAAMSAITNLNQLLIHMEPSLQDNEFVFCTFPGKRYGAYSELEPLCAFQEKEGLTLILPRSQADILGISYDGSYRVITLQVYSSLQTVGLTAAVLVPTSSLPTIMTIFLSRPHKQHTRYKPCVTYPPNLWQKLC
jgi:hypothetical protein